MTCEAWARFHEGDVQFDVVCDIDEQYATWKHDPPHHDPDLGEWDPNVGLYDRSLTPAETRLKR